MTSPETSAESERIAHDHAASRATPLPEEAAGAPTDGDERDAAEEILRESEERITGAEAADEPRDAADQNRRSEETL